MTSLTRVLNFSYDPSQLKRDMNVIFTFAPPTGDPLSDDQNRVAWKVFPLKKGISGGKFTVEFEGDFGFCTTHFNNSKYIEPLTTRHIKPGQRTILEPTDLEPTDTWTTPTHYGGDNFQAKNNTRADKHIGFGTIVKKGLDTELEPTFLFKVRSGSTITADFHPVLMMYCTLEYEQNDLMTAGILTDKFWEQNLNDLKNKVTEWGFMELDDGKYKAEQLL